MNTELSDKKKASAAGKKPRESTDKLLTRILCIVLMVLMVAGLLVSAIYFIINSSVLSASALNEGDQIVRIGLMFGNGVTTGFETTAPHGFVPGAVASDNSFTELWQISDTIVSVTVDANLSKSSMTYSKTSSLSPAVGGYHIQTSQAVSSREEASILLSAMDADASRSGLSAFAAWVDGGYRIRVGQFATFDAASAALAANGGMIGNTPCTVVSPTNTAVSVVDPYSDKILFEFDGNGKTQLGLSPVQAGSEPAYLKTPANNTYCGIFEYSRWISGNIDGVALTNVISLDDYVIGVIPYEIGNTWPLEAQKAFALAVRSYALANLNKHSAYHFDLCNDTDCQAYRGMKLVNDTVIEAVRETSGMVITYEGKIVSTYFSAVTGGSTVSAKDAWGGTTVPYIRAVATPWENYASHKNGEWVDEYSPAELYARVSQRLSKYYPSLAKNFNLRNSISEITINSFATDSSYVYSITLSDPQGHSFTLEKTDTIRLVLGLNSANFVVGKAGETVEVFSFEATETPAVPVGQQTLTAPAAPSAPQQEILSIPTAAPTDSLLAPSSEGVRVVTGDGIQTLTLSESVSLMRGSNGTAVNSVELNLSDFTVKDSRGDHFYDMENEYVSSLISFTPTVPVVPVPTVTLPTTDYTETACRKVTSPITLEGSSGNWVFAGKGWGHGVGMSQIGVRDLAYLGYPYHWIIKAYFPETTVSDYHTLAR